jgi:spore coat polysaccharide biosynthesis predicted glycosyltransferase SpsG
MFIFTEAGSVSGYGHLTRCLAISQNLKKKATMVVHPDDSLKINNLKLYPWRTDPIGAIKFYNLKKSKVALVDSYLVNEIVLKILRDKFKYLIIIDDYDRLKYNCDLLINPSILGTKFKLNKKVKKVYGNKYIIIRNEIKNSLKKNNCLFLKDLTVILGRSNNSKNLFKRIISSIKKLEFENINILTGNDELALELKKSLKLPNCKIYGWLDVFEISSIFINSDLVISSGGQTLNELAYLGVPFIAVESGLDQYWNIQGFIKKKITPIHIKSDDKILDKKLIDTITILKDSSKRINMSSNGTKLIDGDGAFRIANLLENYNDL